MMTNHTNPKHKVHWGRPKFKRAKDATNIVILIRFYEAINYLMLGHMVHRMIEPDVTFKESVIMSFTQCPNQRAPKCKS